jgi:hypothetical protein
VYRANVPVIFQFEFGPFRQSGVRDNLPARGLSGLRRTFPILEPV